MTRIRSIAALLCALAVVGLGRIASAQVSALSSRIPSNANCLLIMDVDKLLASPAAERGRWKDKVEAAAEAGVTLVPPGTSQAIFASQIDLEIMSPVWQSILLKVDSPPESADIAKRNHGIVDQIGQYETVRLPSDAYIVKFPDNVFGLMAPANRQVVGRWTMEVGQRRAPELSPYLLEAHRYAAEVGTPIILAMDFESALTEADIQARLDEAWEEAGFKNQADPKAVAHLLASLRGATLGITFRDRPFGKIKFDFSADTEPINKIAKQLFLVILDRRGLSIDDFEDWTYEASGNQATLEGYFTSEGLHRIFSIFDRPPAVAAASEKPAAAAAVQPSSKEELTAQATLAYYKGLEDCYKGIKQKKDRSSNYTTGSIATWCTNYARKINNLPTLNVDPEMLDFGTTVANTLQEAAQILRGGGAAGAIAATNVGPQYGNAADAYWGGVGYGGYTSYRAAYRLEARAQAGARANVRRSNRSETMMAARQTLSTIEPAAQMIRRAMTERYQVEF